MRATREMRLEPARKWIRKAAPTPWEHKNSMTPLLSSARAGVLPKKQQANLLPQILSLCFAKTEMRPEARACKDIDFADQLMHGSLG